MVERGPAPGAAGGWKMMAATRCHGGESSEGGAPADAAGPRIHRARGEPRRSDPRRSPAASGRSRPCADTRLHAVSRLYETAPVGVVDQPRFRNAVVALDVPAGPDPASGAVALLVALKQLERAFGRQERERWGPRELDLDLLVFGRARLSIDRPPEGMSLDPGKADRLLVVPHREAAERLFVLAPLADLAPRLVPPGWTETVATAAARRLRRRGPRRRPADRDLGRRPTPRGEPIATDG